MKLFAPVKEMIGWQKVRLTDWMTADDRPKTIYVCKQYQQMLRFFYLSQITIIKRM